MLMFGGFFIAPVVFSSCLSTSPICKTTPSTNAQIYNGVFCFSFFKQKKSEKQRHRPVRPVQWKSALGATTNPCCACCMLERAWEIGEKQNEDEEKPNLLASGVIKCYLSFLQYLRWQCFIRDLWPSVLQIYCICSGFCNIKLLWN